MYYQDIIVTVDSVRFGIREADARNAFDSIPPSHRLVNDDDDDDDDPELVESAERYSRDKARTTTTYRDHESHGAGISLEETYNGRKYSAWDQNSELMSAQDQSWEDVRWLKQNVCRNVPLIIKGIMTGDDATLAVQAGADGVMVSNHGGRQQDGCLGTIDALEVVQALQSQYSHVPIFFDGGVRRGTNILKALALGVSAVGIGKPVFFALSVNGEAGVTHMLKIYPKELEVAMALTGCEIVSDITRALVTQHPAGCGPSGSSFIRSSL